MLTANIRQRRLKLTLVDGFAGGGRYLDSRSKEERPGSPLIMLDAMAAAGKAAKEIRSNPFDLDVDYFFIEKNVDALEHLRGVIRQTEYRRMLDDRIRLLKGEFVPQVPSIIDFIKGRGRSGRSIFVLDQFGYSDVPLPMIRNILSELENAEVILTFATDSLIDYLSADEQTQKILDKIGISLPSTTIQSAKTEREWRRTIQFALHREIQAKTEAEFYTPFFIRSSDAHRDFWLIHLSGHARARDVMVGLHWQESTCFAHYGRSGLRMLGYEQETDQDWTKQTFLPGFYFDETARASSQEELFQQLPERLHKFKDGVTFDKMFSDLTNESPVTAKIMQDVVSDLARQGFFHVYDKSGGKRRAGIQHRTDVIKPSRQRRFLPP